jgi:hypothetical protein
VQPETEKSEELAPVIILEEMVMLELAWLVTKTLCAAAATPTVAEARLTEVLEKEGF